MKFSCVLFCALAFVSCIFVSLFKKTSSRLLFSFFSFIFCSAFLASNSLQIFQLIPCKSLWDLTCLVSWGDKCFLCDELDLTGQMLSVEPNPLGTTEPYNSVSPISLQERHLATCFCILFDPAPLNESCPWPASHSTCCFVLWLKDQSHHDKNPEEPFLEIDVKGGERDHHIKA